MTSASPAALSPSPELTPSTFPQLVVLGTDALFTRKIPPPLALIPGPGGPQRSRPQLARASSHCPQLSSHTAATEAVWGLHRPAAVHRHPSLCKSQRSCTPRTLQGLARRHIAVPCARPGSPDWPQGTERSRPRREQKQPGQTNALARRLFKPAAWPPARPHACMHDELALACLPRVAGLHPLPRRRVTTRAQPALPMPNAPPVSCRRAAPALAMGRRSTRGLHLKTRAPYTSQEREHARARPGPPRPPRRPAARTRARPSARPAGGEGGTPLQRRAAPARRRGLPVEGALLSSWRGRRP
jgi:hypothetical protein